MSRGGFRCGAGRPSTRLKVEDLFRIDIADLRRIDLFNEPCKGQILLDDAVTPFVFDEGRLTIALPLVAGSITASIDVVEVPCNFGGKRHSFRCPVCHQKRRVLCLVEADLQCRICAGAFYRSQGIDALARSWRQQRKLERRLGPNAAKPLRMHFATYLRLIERIEKCKARRDQAILSLGVRLFPHLISHA